MMRAWISSRSTCCCAIACAVGIQGSAFAVDHEVMAMHKQFVPSEITVAPGDTINWIWMDGDHTVTSGVQCIPDFKFFNAPLTRRDPTFSYVVPDTLEGQIPYFCIPHCDEGMIGMITVVPASNPADIAPPGGDGIVGPADLGELLSQWGQCPVGEECTADLAPPPDGDGTVGPPDLAELLANWTA